MQRAAAILGALALAFQAGAPVWALRAPASCCCAKRSVKCHCPACNHARDLESGGSFVQTCAPSTAPAAVAQVPPAVPALHAISAPIDRAPVPAGPPPSGPPDPTVEVPTPPPLQA